MKEKTRQERKGKIWVIGLDGATFRLIDPWVQSGKLPSLARLKKNGSSCILRSPVPETPTAWASFMTGCNPGKHGIFEWIQPFPQSYKEHVTQGGSCDCPTLWSLLSGAGRRVGIVNVPMTYPPEDVDGFFVSGLDTPYGNENFTRPGSLLEELTRHFGPYTVLPQIIDIPLSETVENFLRTIEQREKIMHFLLDKNKLDFFILIFNATDSLQHLCLSGFGEKDMNSPPLKALLTVYQKIDAVLGGLLERMPEDVALIVLSDHGAGPLNAYVHLDNWLAKQGWLRYADTNPSLVLRRKWAQLSRWTGEGLKKLLPEQVKNRFRDRLRRLRILLDRTATAPYLDWPRTRAFSFGSQGVYLNVSGRQPSGSVQPGREYEHLLDRITQALYKLNDPVTDRRIVSKVLRKEEMFSGPHLDSAPDLYIYWTDDAYISWSNPLHPRDQMFVRPKSLEIQDTVITRDQGRHVGCHRQEGILIMYGALVKKGKKIPESSILDVAPTILYLMGEQIPAYMEGHVLETAVTDGYLKNHPIQFSDEVILSTSPRKGYGQKEIELAKSKLRDLGYL